MRVALLAGIVGFAVLVAGCEDGDGSIAPSPTPLVPTAAIPATRTESHSSTPTATPTPATPSPQPATPTATTVPAPPEILRAAAEWPLPNRDYAQTRAVLDSPITSATIDALEVAWTFPIPGPGFVGAASSAPLVLEGRVYFQDLGSNVFAVDLASGRLLWSRRYDVPTGGPNGPAAGYGKVFATVPPDHVIALDVATGADVWSTRIGHPVGASQPVVYDGRVYLGTMAASLEGAGYTAGTSGFAFALDAGSGAIEWSFRVVEEGFWGHPEINSGGGIRYPPAIDTNIGRVFWGTGNPAPFPGTLDYPNATSRPGPNPHANSMLAFEAGTGRLAWATSAVERDIFDHDFQDPPILARVPIDGRERDIVVGAGKLGRVLAFDRASGEVLWDVPVGTHENDDRTELAAGEVVRVEPGFLGGVTTPMAYADGTVYVPVVNLATETTATGWDAANGTEAAVNADIHTPLEEGTGEVVALDASTGAQRWATALDAMPLGGATVVADLVIVPTFDGILHVFRRSDGMEVWSWEAPAGIIAWPAVSGDTIIVAAGSGDSPTLMALRLGAGGE